MWDPCPGQLRLARVAWERFVFGVFSGDPAPHDIFIGDASKSAEMKKLFRRNSFRLILPERNASSQALFLLDNSVRRC
jgi:hypothetical protein